VFPEGRHTTDGRIAPFRAGVGLLANSLAIPIVPLRIDGLFEVKKAKKKFARSGKIKVKIGAPVRFPPDSAPHRIAAELQEVVENL
jgi:1-acyl-sn-glycerol-3-phosphate acyltransferase